MRFNPTKDDHVLNSAYFVDCVSSFGFVYAPHEGRSKVLKHHSSSTNQPSLTKHGIDAENIGQGYSSCLVFSSGTQRMKVAQRR